MQQFTQSKTLDEALILGLDFYYTKIFSEFSLLQVSLITKEEFEKLASDEKVLYQPCRTVMIAKSVILANIGDSIEQIDSHELLNDLAGRISLSEMEHLDFIQGRRSRLGGKNTAIRLQRFLLDLKEVTN